MSLASLKRELKKKPRVFNAVKSCYHVLCWAFKYPKRSRESRRLLSALDEACLDKEEHIWYFGVATHPNLGDLAQTCCTLRWLENNYPGRKVVEIPSRQFDFAEKACMYKLRAVIKEDDLIIFQSGYTLTDEHEHTRMRNLILYAFPRNRTVLLPQTIHYQSAENETDAFDPIRKHENILLLARDRVSFETAKNLLPGKQVVLYPDIVTSLIGTISTKEERNGVLFCIRDDYEKLYSDKHISSLMGRISKVTSISKKDTTIKIKNIWDRKQVWKDILDTVLDYASYRVIVTDRYHGTIFSLVAETPVVVLKTTDHKVITGAEWFESLYPNHIKVAKDLDEAERHVNHILEKEGNYHLEPYFKNEYYSKLKQLIERCE